MSDTDKRNEFLALALAARRRESKPQSGGGKQEQGSRRAVSARSLPCSTSTHRRTSGSCGRISSAIRCSRRSFVPLTPKWDYEKVKDFSQRLVVHMTRTIPTLFVAKSGARNRVGRIFIDYLRNGRGATTAAAFSARARPGMGVSVPVTWKELPGLTGADQWNIFNVFDRLKKQRVDPWKACYTTQQTLEGAAKQLGDEG